MSNNIDAPHQAGALDDKQNAAMSHTPRPVRLRENNTDNSPQPLQDTQSHAVQADINNQSQNIAPPLPQQIQQNQNIPSENINTPPQDTDHTTDTSDDRPIAQALQASRDARAKRREARIEAKVKAKVNTPMPNTQDETTQSVLSKLYGKNNAAALSNNDISDGVDGGGQAENIISNMGVGGGIAGGLTAGLGTETVSGIDTKALTDILTRRDDNAVATDNTAPLASQSTDAVQNNTANITKDIDNLLNNKPESAAERLARVMQGVKVSPTSSETIADKMKSTLSRLKGKAAVAVNLGKSLETMGIVRKKTDSLTLNLELTNPVYKPLVHELSKRSQTDIRAGKETKIIQTRDNSPQANVGEIFTGKKRKITDLSTPFTPETQEIMNALNHNPRPRRRALPADMRADSLRSTLLEQQNFQARILPNQPISVF